ncbi:caspase family protein [Streptomyces sp. CA-249302]|uniref:caspase family protein n=1 Tax=Streptomyces sp. CA-249302 TaxID=3240058 RepID=UPI003D8E1C93
MARHRALLIGASDYGMRGVPPLRFVPDDLAILESALRNHGFDDVQVLTGLGGGRQVSRNFVIGEVSGFLKHASTDDTLLILLSGHGVHARGRDYLVPEDIHEHTHPFEAGCVPIDWHAELDETPASRVVFLIDACREGIEQESMGLAGITMWSKQKVSAALRRKVAYVYACSPGQYALFVRPPDVASDPVARVRPGDSFSIFSRSVSDVIADHRGTTALDLVGFRDAVQERMRELHRAYRKRGRPQDLKIVADLPFDGFSFSASYSSATRSVGTAAPVSKRARRSFRRPEPWAIALVFLGMLGVLAWTLVTHGTGDTGDRGSASDKSGSSTSPTSTPSKSSGPPTAELGSSLPNCTPEAVELTVRSSRNTYGGGQNPTLLVTAKNSSDNDCKVDLGPKKAVVTISSAQASGNYWSSADCPEPPSGSVLYRAPAHDTVTYTVKWNRRPSVAHCASPPKGSAGAGAYLADLKAKGFGEAETSFVLDSDTES